MAESNLEPKAELVDYVQTMLSEGTRFNKIAESLNISDPRQLKRMMTKALGYKFRVHQTFTTEEMSNTIQGALPIREHGANWGIRHVKAALARLGIRAPRRTVEKALQSISWTSHIHIQDMHAQDNQEHIGTQDLGPRGLRTWTARRGAPNPTLCDIPDLPADLLALRNASYVIGKVAKDILQCFHLHYFLSHYCYMSQESAIPIGQLVPLKHSSGNTEAFQLLLRTISG